jgi:protein gp37
MTSEWAKDIRRQCRRDGIPFFFKQWGGVFKKNSGRTLDGRVYNELPAILTLA